MLKFENVIKIYDGKHPPKAALNNVSFELPSKGMVFILGKSGSGKTTLLNLLGGMDRATKGSVFFEGKDIERLSKRDLDCYRAHCVGFVPRDFCLLENLSVKANLQLTEQLLRKKYSDKQIGDVLQAVDLAGYEGKKCNLLSSGEKQRVSIAQTLVKDSKVILADEPTEFLDSENGEQIYNILKKISATRLVVVASTDTEAAKRFADYTVRIKDGEVVEKLGINDDQSDVANEFKLEKKFDLKTSAVIKTAFSNIKLKLLSILLSFIVCFLGLTFFFVGNVIANEDAPSKLVTALRDNDVLNGRIERKDEDSYHPAPMLTIDDVNKICDDNPELKFYKINYRYGGLFGIECKGVAELPQKDAQSQKFVYGESPEDFNSFFVTKSYAEKLLSNAAGKQDVTDMDSLVGYNIVLYGKEFTLCGIVEDSELYDYYVYFNDGFFNSIADAYEKDNLEGICDYLYFTMSGDFDADYSFFKKYHGDALYYETDSEYIINTALSNEFYGKVAVYLEMAKWFYGISVAFFAAFIVIICINAFSSAILKRQKENDVLRALGYGNSDILKIYLLQTAFPYILLIPLVGIVGYIIVSIINKSLLAQLSVSIGLFAIGAWNVVWLLLLCVGILIIGTFLPMIKLFKKQR